MPHGKANDNVQSIALQGYAGIIFEYSVCHLNIPSTKDGGPHGLHRIGQTWVSGHGSFAQDDITQCATCHGTDYRGTFLSQTADAGSFNANEFGMKTYSKGDRVSCYDCHNGPHSHDILNL